MKKAYDEFSRITKGQVVLVSVPISDLATLIDSAAIGTARRVELIEVYSKQIKDLISEETATQEGKE